MVKDLQSGSVCLIGLWVLLVLIFSVHHLTVEDTTRGLARVPENVIDGLNRIVGFARWKKDVAAVQRAANQCMELCGLDKRHCSGGKVDESALKDKAKRVDIDLYVTSMRDSFDASLSAVHSVMHDRYLRTGAFKSVGDDLRHMDTKITSLVSPASCLDASNAGCMISHDAETVQTRANEIDAQIGELKSAFATEATSLVNNPQNIMFLVVLPYTMVFTMAILSFAWIRKYLELALLPPSNTWARVLVTSLALSWLFSFAVSAMACWASMATKNYRMRTNVIAGDPTLTELCQHFKTHYPEFSRYVFGNMHLSIRLCSYTAFLFHFLCIMIFGFFIYLWYNEQTQPVPSGRSIFMEEGLQNLLELGERESIRQADAPAEEVRTRKVERRTLGGPEEVAMRGKICTLQTQADALEVKLGMVRAEEQKLSARLRALRMSRADKRFQEAVQKCKVQETSREKDPPLPSTSFVGRLLDEDEVQRARQRADSAPACIRPRLARPTLRASMVVKPRAHRTLPHVHFPAQLAESPSGNTPGPQLQAFNMAENDSNPSMTRQSDCSLWSNSSPWQAMEAKSASSDAHASGNLSPIVSGRQHQPDPAFNMAEKDTALNSNVRESLGSLCSESVPWQKVDSSVDGTRKGTTSRSLGSFDTSAEHTEPETAPNKKSTAKFGIRPLDLSKVRPEGPLQEDSENAGGHDAAQAQESTQPSSSPTPAVELGKGTNKFGLKPLNLSRIAPDGSLKQGSEETHAQDAAEKSGTAAPAITVVKPLDLSKLSQGKSLAKGPEASEAHVDARRSVGFTCDADVVRPDDASADAHNNAAGGNAPGRQSVVSALRRLQPHVGDGESWYDFLSRSQRQLSDLGVPDEPLDLFELFYKTDDAVVAYSSWARLFHLASAPNQAGGRRRTSLLTVAPPWDTDAPGRQWRYPYEVIRLLLGGNWKAKRLWALFDLRCSRPEYADAQPCGRGGRMEGKHVVVVGAGPCGLRTAIELRLLGARVTIVDKREHFTRINQLHLWGWLGEELKQLGARTIEPPPSDFASDPDKLHICIRDLQMLLVKVCLILGVEVLLGTEYRGCEWVGDSWSVRLRRTGAAQLAAGAAMWSPRVPPSPRLTTTSTGTNTTPRTGAAGGAPSPRAQPGTSPSPQPSPMAPSEIPNVAALVGATGMGCTIGKDAGMESLVTSGLKAESAIGLVCNFVRTNSTAEGRLRSFSLARQFYAQLFSEAEEKTGAELENIVYVKGHLSHYFVMTPTRRSLIECGIVAEAGAPVLSRGNIDAAKLDALVRRVIAFPFKKSQPTLFEAFEKSHPGEVPPYADSGPMLFDFSKMCRSLEGLTFVPPPDGPGDTEEEDESEKENDSDAESKESVEVPEEDHLLVALVGDALIEPFWPEGLGIARGFFGAWDVCAAIADWGAGHEHFHVLEHFQEAYAQLKTLSAATRSRVLLEGDKSHVFALAPSTRYRVFDPVRRMTRRITHRGSMETDGENLRRSPRRRKSTMRRYSDSTEESGGKTPTTPQTPVTTKKAQRRPAAAGLRSSQIEHRN